MRAPLLLTLALGCRPPEPPPEDTAPDTAEAAGDEPLSLEVDRIALIAVAAPSPDPELPRGAELSGLVAAQLELGLADLDGVVPQVGTSAVAPGLARALTADAERWTATTTLHAAGERLEIRLSLCAADACTDLASKAGTREEPAPGVAELVEAIADRMLRGEAAGSSDERPLPTSPDPYAVLLTGRSAATFYGLLPATPEDQVGNKRRDPVARALLVDPETAVGNWIAGRRALGLGEAGAARGYFTRAAFNRPTSDVLIADEASAQLAGGHPEAAWYALQQLEGRRPHDHRFTLLTVSAALAAGRPGEALDRLEALPEALRGGLDAVTATVSALEALGLQADPRYDDALARWASLAPADPEPVRRRVRIRVLARAYADALPLVAELAQRGAGDESIRLEMALLNALQRPSDAAARAMALGELDLADRLRAAAGGSPAEAADALGDETDPRAMASRAAALAQAGRASEALQVAEAALKAHPWLPEALSAQAEALAKLGRSAEAQKVIEKLCFADPAENHCNSNI